MYNVEANEAPQLRNSVLNALGHVIMPPNARIAVKQAISGLRLLLAECQGKSRHERRELFVKKVERAVHTALAGAGVAPNEVNRIIDDLMKELKSELHY